MSENSKLPGLSIKIDLKQEEGRDSAAGIVKRNAMDMADQILEQELGQVRAWVLNDGVVAVAPLRMFRREYSMDSWRVNIRLTPDPKQVPQVLVDMGRARAEIDLRSWPVRMTHAIVRFLFGNDGKQAIAKASQKQADRYTRGYIHEVATLAVGCAQKAVDGLMIAKAGGSG